MLRRILGGAAIASAALALLVQVVPYGRAHANPPVQAEPSWTSPQVQQLAARACFDCHSNQTRWPWYSSVAPVSRLVQRDVEEGRAKLNFSEWGRRQEAREAPEQVTEGEMPPGVYLLLHGDAKLAPAERQTLASGLAAITAGLPGARGERSGREGRGR